MAHMEIEDYFAQAVDRLLAGESIDEILVSYPPRVHGELRSLLVVVEAAERMATAAAPAPASLNRVSARLHFARRASELRDELAAVSAATPVVPLPSAASTVGDTPRPSVWQRLRQEWNSIRPPTPLLRLAPLTAVLLIAFLSTFTIVVSAQESLPGDQIYGLKKWMREQRVATAPPALQAEERHTADEEQAHDVEKAVEEMQNKPSPTAIQDLAEMQFLGTRNGLYQIGNLLVVPSYRPDINDHATWMPMTILGDLMPGIEVELHYQIVPSMPDVVEGISLRVVPSRALPTPDPTPTPTYVPDNGCQRVQPPNWIRYTVRPGETLGSIATRGNVSNSHLRTVNCLTDGPLNAGTTIFVPETIALPQSGMLPADNTPQTPLMPTATQLPPTGAPTLTPDASTTAEPVTVTPATTATETSSATPEPTEIAVTPFPGTEENPTEGMTPGATATPESSTATPPQNTGTPPASPTVIPTTEVESGTPSTAIPSTSTATPVNIGTPSASPTPTMTAPTAVASPEAPATPTISASPSAIPGNTATSTPVAPTNTQIATSTATEVTGSTEGGSAAISTSTATAVPPTAVPPTAAPPTAVPPTAVPPTAVPTTAAPPTAVPTTASTTDGSETP